MRGRRGDAGLVQEAQGECGNHGGGRVIETGWGGVLLAPGGQIQGSGHAGKDPVTSHLPALALLHSLGRL